MALKKQILKDNGISANYHKISSVKLITEEVCILVIETDSFMDKTYREKNYPIFHNRYVFDIADDEDIDIGIRELGYQKLKTLEVFADAQDC